MSFFKKAREEIDTERLKKDIEGIKKWFSLPSSKRKLKKVIVILIVLYLLYFAIIILFTPLTGHGGPSLDGIYYSSEEFHNKSIPNLVNTITSLNLSKYKTIVNESQLTMNQTGLINFFMARSGISYYGEKGIYSFEALIISTESFYFNNTELKNYFGFILVSSDNGTIRFVSGVKVLKRIYWLVDHPNFEEYKELVHQQALHKTQEILKVLNLHPTEVIIFQEYYG